MDEADREEVRISFISPSRVTEGEKLPKMQNPVFNFEERVICLNVFCMAHAVLVWKPVDIIGDIDVGRSPCQYRWITCTLSINISSFQYRTFTMLSLGNCYEYTPDAIGSLLSFPLLTILCLRSRDLSSGSLNLLRFSSDLLSVRTLRSLLSNSKTSSIISRLFSIRILSCAVSARMFLAFNSK